MKKLLIILPVLFFIGCTLTPKKNIQSKASKELTTLTGVTYVGSVLMYAEEYKSQTNADFSKAGLRVVFLFLQNTSSVDTYHINIHDIHGAGDLNILKQIDYNEAIELMKSSGKFIETAKDVEVVRTVSNVAAGALIGGSIGGFYFGYDLFSLAVAGTTGAFIGGSYELIKGINGKEAYYGDKAIGIITDEIGSEKLPHIIAVPPGSKIHGILIFPKDVPVFIVNIKEIR